MGGGGGQHAAGNNTYHRGGDHNAAGSICRLPRCLHIVLVIIIMVLAAVMV